MLEINFKSLKSEKRVHVKGHQTKSGYVKPHIRVVKTAAQADAEMNAKMAALQSYKNASEQTNKWIKNNPDRRADIAEINDYTVDNYGFINEALRVGMKGDEFIDYRGEIFSVSDINNQVESISSFLNDAPKFKGIVYRSMTFNIRDIKGIRDYEEFMRSIEGFDVCTMKTFSSTSININKAQEFRIPNNINVIMKIKSKNGVALNGATHFPKEQEVLLNKDSKFNIISIDKDGRNIYIELEEI